MNKPQHTSDFEYELPPELIARRPLEARSQSRLLVLDRKTGDVSHQLFTQFLDYINPNDLIVFNNTKVIPARLLGAKATGGKIECLIERIIEPTVVLAHIRSSKSPKVDSELIFNGDIVARVIGREEALFKLAFDGVSAIDVLNMYGEMPIPPYLERAADEQDDDRYQSVFAEKEGAVAAPTASLHFDQAMLSAMTEKGVATAMVTLHIGAGTFQPVRTESLKDHIMHKEYIEVDEAVCEKIRQTKAAGGRIIAIGTTVVRSLETAASQGEISPYVGDTNIFIYPGYEFKCVDVLFTNFHLPRSTLLMLVCAFAGHEQTMNAYHAAVQEQYRFFSYGDAMVVV